MTKILRSEGGDLICLITHHYKPNIPQQPHGTDPASSIQHDRQVAELSLDETYGTQSGTSENWPFLSLAFPMPELADVFPSLTARYVHLNLLKPVQSVPGVLYRGSRSSSSIKALVTGLRR